MSSVTSRLGWIDFMLNPCRILAAMGLVVVPLIVIGCGSGAPPKHIVKGRITYKGEPMEVKRMVGRLRVSFVQQDVPPPVDP
jgi:methyl coenzyme M reductase subunit D